MQAYTPRETGLDKWIAYDKGEFIGREAASADRRNAGRKLVTLEIEDGDSDATGYEPIWLDGRRVGYVTSGGYGHVVGKSLAMALVEPGRVGARDQVDMSHSGRGAQRDRNSPVAVRSGRNADAQLNLSEHRIRKRCLRQSLEEVRKPENRDQKRRGRTGTRLSTKQME